MPALCLPRTCTPRRPRGNGCRRTYDATQVSSPELIHASSPPSGEQRMPIAPKSAPSRPAPWPDGASGRYRGSRRPQARTGMLCPALRRDWSGRRRSVGGAHPRRPAWEAGHPGLEIHTRETVTTSPHAVPARSSPPHPDQVQHIRLQALTMCRPQNRPAQPRSRCGRSREIFSGLCGGLFRPQKPPAGRLPDCLFTCVAIRFRLSLSYPEVDWARPGPRPDAVRARSHRLICAGE